MSEYGEPWKISECESSICDSSEEIVAIIDGTWDGVRHDDGPTHDDAERIIDCVNALAGVRAPLEWVPLVLQLLGECRGVVHSLEFDWEEAGNDPDPRLVDLLKRIDESLDQHEKQGDQ